MSKTWAFRLALSLAVLFLAPAVLSQEADKRVPVSSAPRTGCEPETCVSKVLHFPNSPTAFELQNVVNTLRVIVDITSLNSNSSEHTISLKGTPDQFAIAEKLVSVLESLRSGGQRSSSVLVYQPTGAPLNAHPASRMRCELTDCLIKVLYLPNFSTPFELQDAVNILRTIADITSIVPNPSGPTIALKGTPEQVAVAERLVSVLEALRSSGGQNRSSVLVYELKGSMPAPTVAPGQPPLPPTLFPCEVTSCFIKVLYLPDFSATQTHDLINRIRTTTQMTRTVPSSSGHVIVIRGTSEQVAVAERLTNE